MSTAQALPFKMTAAQTQERYPLSQGVNPWLVTVWFFKKPQKQVKPASLTHRET